MLPTEIWEFILEYLPTYDVARMSRVSKLINVPAIRSLYKEPKFHPLASRSNWIEFVDRINRSGSFQYGKNISTIDDIWLFIGGEETKDSAVELEEKIPRYSIAHLIELVIPSLRNLRIHFSSVPLLHISWHLLMTGLTTLHLDIRVTDGLLDTIIHSSKSMESISFPRAEITNRGLHRLADCFENLRQIDVSFVPISQRSRYHILSDPSLSNPVTNDGVAAMIIKCQKLSKVHLNGIGISPTVFELLNKPKITSLALGLDGKSKLSMETIPHLLSGFSQLKILVIRGSTNRDASITDTTIDEDFLLNLPLVAPIKRLELHGCDISRNDRGCRLYYGSKNSPWELDSFKKRFAEKHDATTLYLEYPLY
jgi:hypothetical protein